MNWWLFTAGAAFVGATAEGYLVGTDWKLLVIYMCLATVNVLFGAL